MGCCQALHSREREISLINQSEINVNFSPKTIQVEPFSLNLIKGDNDGIVSYEQIERMGSTCVDNILQERQQQKLEKQCSVHVREEVVIDLRVDAHSGQLKKDRSSKNLNNKFIGML